MRLLPISLTIIGALTLAACGSSDADEVTWTDAETGETMTIDTGEASMTFRTDEGELNVRGGTDVPVSLPGNFSLIDGSNVISNTIFNQPDSRGAMVLFETSMSPAEVIDHYRGEAEAAGVQIQIESNTNGTRMIGGEGPDGLTMSVTATPSGDGSSAQLVIGEGG